MSRDIYLGPTADQLLPSKRLNPDALYAEHLIALFGSEDATAGVALEIVDATGGLVVETPDSSKKKGRRAPTIWLAFKAPKGGGLLSVATGDEAPSPKKLGANQTNKAALKAAFGTPYISQWVGWVTLYVDHNVDDPRKGGKTSAIRIRRVRPNLPPTFDYAANVAKRVARAQAQRDEAIRKGTTPVAMAMEMSDAQRAAIAQAQAAEDAQGAQGAQDAQGDGQSAQPASTDGAVPDAEEQRLIAQQEREASR